MTARILPFVFAVLLSVIVLFTPESGVPSSPPGTDKVVHTVLFALLAATALWARAGLRTVVVGLVAYAALSEVLQQVITPLHRSGDVVDALVDVVGVALGVFLFTRVGDAVRTRRRDRRTSR